MKVCFIGNSHLGHAAPAWRKLRPQYADISIDFFVERTYGQHKLVLTGSSGNTTFSNVPVAKDDSVNVDSYDSFAIFAMTFSPLRLVDIYRNFRPFDSATGSKARLISEDAFVAAAKDTLRSSKGVQVLDALRKLTDKPILLVPQPYPLRWSADREGENFRVFHDLVSSRGAVFLHDVFQDAASRAVDGAAQLVWQPENTTDGPFFTKSQYGLALEGDLDPSGLFARGDYYHMNESFGMRVLEVLLPIIDQK